MSEKPAREELEKRVHELEQTLSERKRVIDSLEKRLLDLTHPPADGDGIAIEFEDLFNMDEIQLIQDRFAEATGVASIITHIDGKPITQPSNFCRLCSDIIRKTERGLVNCYRSDAIIGHHHPEGPIIQPCLSGGLWDAGASIIVGNRHIANWLIGQVRNEEQTEEKMVAYAREIGVDEQTVLDAFRAVPTMPRERFENIARCLFTLANQLSKFAFQTVQQARFIFDRKRVEQELKESEALYQDLVETSQDLIWRCDTEGRYTYLNPAWELVFGYSLEEMLGKKFSEFQTAEMAAKDRKEFNHLMQGGSVNGLETIHLGKAGNEIHLVFNAKFLTDGNGRAIGTRGTAYDITKRKQYEQSLRQSEERYRNITNHSPLGMHLYELQPDGKLVFQAANPAADRILKVDHRQFIGKTIQEAFPPLIKTEIPERYRLAAQDGTPWHTEQVEYQDGSISGAFDVHAFQVSAGRMVAVFMDITERKQSEAEKEKLQEQLLQAQKMEAVGRLAGGVAHDFNNMLSVIIGRAELALMKLQPSDPLYKDLREIETVGKRSAVLTRQLLGFARRQTITPRVINLNDTIESMLKMLRRLIGEDINLLWKPAADLWPVKMDPAQIDQILANLVVNARDAIQDVGKITIETANVVLDVAYCAAHADLVPGHYTLLAFSDNGCGMDRETLASIFEPFFTTKPIGQGTGLGLATVYGIVKQNKGFINVYSEPGKGTTFKIFQPRYASPIDQTSIEESKAAATGGKETILLVEDETAILEVAQMMLVKLGYTLLTATTPDEAIRLAEAYTGEIHLLITDVVMPGMNGRDLAGRLLTPYPSIKQLFMSGYTANVIAHHGVLEEGVHFIQKPFSIKDLASKVREALD